MSRQPILIVGASGRAAAASALRAGFDPFVLDLFADADTERLCPVFKLPMDDYPHGFVDLAKHIPPMPWMYTGGLENYPDVVGAISESRELWGNGPEVLRKVRDPIALSDRMRQFWENHPASVRSGREPPADGKWLRKSLRGSAGHGIRIARAADWDDKPDDYLQEFVDGPSMSAIFTDGRIGWPTFVGLTRQLIGTPWLHAKPFAYAGNILADPNRGPDTRPTAGWLTNEFPLVGVWGFDFIHANGRIAVLEVNPRYTASVEIVEHATRIPALAQTEPAAANRAFGKAIYFAPHRIEFPASGPWDDSLAHCTDVWRRPDFADIPHAGDTIEAGHPVLTIFAEAPDDTECEAKLKARAAELDSLFAVR